MGKCREITEFAPKILKMGEIYTDSEMCRLEALVKPDHSGAWGGGLVGHAANTCISDAMLGSV